MANPVSRREFIGTATSGMLLAGGLAARPTEAADNAGWTKMPPVRIYVAQLGTGGACPKPEFDAPATLPLPSAACQACYCPRTVMRTE